MIRLTSFVVFVISLVACNSQESRSLRPTPMFAPPAATAAPVSVNASGGSIDGGDGRTGESTGTIACTTIKPGLDWICVNGGWVPPDHPLADRSTGSADGGAPPGSGSPAPSPEPRTNSCTTLQPGPNWICVNGGWLPHDHPLAAGSAGSGGANGSGGSSNGGSSGATGTCTTPDPFIGTQGIFGARIEGVCVGGDWIPSNHPIALALPVPDYTGGYALVISAVSCSPGFPEQAKQRMYNARIEQTGRNLRVRLSGADFLLGSGNFSGEVSPTGEVRFFIREADFYYYTPHELAERFTSSSALFVTGDIRTRATATGIAGTLSGRFTLMQGVAVPFMQTLGTCVAEAHRFELVRQ
jgi:hypothetical protein